MNRTIRAIIAVFLVCVITFAAISVCQNLFRLKLDVTEQKLYTLSDGTKSILGKLSSPIKLKLYYTKIGAMKANNDQIKFFINYYYYVKSLLEEYAANSDMVELEVIDPRPFTEDEAEAMRLGLKRFSITQDEGFFFGLALQTQFGVTKTIDFFTPDRERFIEYDISYLIDTAMRREKKRLGVLSSLSVMGDTGYMAQMLAAQGKSPKPKWGIITQLEQKYEVSTIETDVDEIKDIDILFVIHPKELPEKTQFAIDQYILNGGNTIICVDPHCLADRPDPAMQMQMQQKSSSSLETLLNAWGLTVPENTFAGDLALTVVSSTNPTQPPQPILALMNLDKPECFNQDSVITAELNTIRLMFPGVINEIPVTKPEGQDVPEYDIKLTKLLTTTSEGNSWKVSSPFELQYPRPADWIKKFSPGTEPVAIGYMVSGKLPSAFPEGIEVEDDSAEQPAEEGQDEESQEKKTKKVTGLKVASQDCSVMVFADVDFVNAAYQDTGIFGLAVVGDNAALIMNGLDEMAGSSDLIEVRTRGNYRRPFTRVDKIEKEAEEATKVEEEKLNAQIQNLESQLNNELASAKEINAEVIANTIQTKQRELQTQIIQARNELRKVRKTQREGIEKLGVNLRAFCTFPGPLVILILAVIVAVRRSAIRRHYISHASDS